MAHPHVLPGILYNLGSKKIGLERDNLILNLKELYYRVWLTCRYGMKKCNKCDVEKSLDDFRKRKNRSGNTYIIAVCIICEREQKRACEKRRYSNFSKEQYKKHLESSKRSREKESYKVWHRKWQKEKEETDIKFKIKRRVSSLIRSSINKNNKTVFSFLDYTIDELKQHLESQFEPWMSWDNWGVYSLDKWDDNDESTWAWQIDHIVPVFNFEFKSTDDNEFKECWSLKNLRPLSAKDNLKKGKR